MVMNFVTYKLGKLFVCLMCFQMFFVCINHCPQFTPLLLGPFQSVNEGFYCNYFKNSEVSIAFKTSYNEHYFCNKQNTLSKQDASTYSHSGIYSRSLVP
jgi:hypothetical protein